MKQVSTKQYALALFDLSLEQKKIEYVKEHLKIVSESISLNKKFIKILSHPKVSKQEKKDMMKEIFNNFDDLILHFLYVIIDNECICDIDVITNEYNDLYNEYTKVIIVKAQTTEILEKEQIDRLKVKLMNKYRHKIEIINDINKSLIGGMRLYIKDEIIDYSLKSQIENLKSSILKQN